MIYEPLQHQKIFHESQAKYRLLGGSAGPGKSKALRMEAVNQCINASNVKGVILRRTYPELETSIIIPLLEELPKNSYSYNSSKHYMTFNNGSMLFFMHCQYEKDVYRLQGAEFDFVGIDELTHFNEYLFQYILTRLRTSKENIEPNFFAATNPGGVGHHFVKRLWIDRQYQEHENPDDFHYIPARVYDNPHIMNNDPEYVRRLEQLPDKQRRALLEGDWDVFEGQFFSEFRRDIHVVDPFIPTQEYGYKENIVAVDYGYSAPTAILWMSIDNQKNVIIYREVYKTELLYQDVVREIIDNTTEEEDIKIAVFDPAVVNKRIENSGKPAKQILYDSGLKQAGIKIIPGNNNRIDGWNTCREYIKPFVDKNTGNQISKFKVGSNCTNVIRTIPSLIHDKTKIEDADTTGEDHACIIGESLVKTVKGDKQIKNINIGELVYTPFGTKKVINSGLTRQSVEVKKLILSNGSEIVATPDHNIFTIEDKRRLDTLRYGDIIKVYNYKSQKCVSKSYLQQSRSLMERDIINAEIILAGRRNRKKEVGDCIEKYGNTITEKLKNIFIYTIKMVIYIIIRLIIYSCFPVTHIANYMARQEQQNISKNIGKKRLKKQKNGIGARREKNGTSSMEKKFLGIWERLKDNANNVIQSFKPETETENFAVKNVNQNGGVIQELIILVRNANYVVQNILQTNTKKQDFAVVVALEKVGEKHDVYNLTVSDEHCYFANNILVANCDAWRYGQMYLLGRGKRMKEVKEVREVFKKKEETINHRRRRRMSLGDNNNEDTNLYDVRF